MLAGRRHRHRLPNGLDVLLLEVPDTFGAKLEGLSFPLTAWAGIDGRVWKSGLSLDLDELGRFAARVTE